MGHLFELSNLVLEPVLPGLPTWDSRLLVVLATVHIGFKYVGQRVLLVLFVEELVLKFDEDVQVELDLPKCVLDIFKQELALVSHFGRLEPGVEDQVSHKEQFESFISLDVFEVLPCKLFRVFLGRRLALQVYLSQVAIVFFGLLNELSAQVLRNLLVL